MQYYRLSGEVNYFKQKLPYYHLREIYRVDKWCGTCYRPVSSHTTGGMWGNIFISLYWRIIIALIIQDIFPWHNHLIHCVENKEIDMNFIKDIEVKGFVRFISKFIIDTLCIGTVLDSLYTRGCEQSRWYCVHLWRRVSWHYWRTGVEYHHLLQSDGQRHEPAPSSPTSRLWRFNNVLVL